MRGAVSIALAFKQFTYSGVTWNPVHATMITSTLVVVLFSTLVFGILTKPLMDVLLRHHKHGNSKHPKANSSKEPSLPLLSAEGQSNLSLLLERPVDTVHAYWRKFDDAYMRPVFGGPVCGS